MRETLYIRLRATDPAAPTAYCVAGSDAVASFVVEQAPLQEVLAQVGQRRLVVLVPSADVRLTSVQLPARQMAKVLQAVPFALEDQLAEDVETLHFALGARRPDGNWPVAVVSRQRVDAWLGCLQQLGYRPDALIPDVLALPVPAPAPLPEAEQSDAPPPRTFSLLIDGPEVVVRTALDGGFVCQRDDLELCLQIADPERKATLRAIVPRDQAFDPSTLNWPVELLHGFADPLEALLQHLHSTQAIDLLQGPYSVEQDWLRYWQPWRLAASLAGAALLVGGLVHGVQAYRYGQEASVLRDANLERYQQLFPNETRIVDLSTQLEQQIAQLSDSGRGPALFALMQVLSDALTAVSGLDTQSLQYRENALYVGLSASSLQTLEQLKQWFETPRDARLEVQSANSGSEGVQIRIRLTSA